MSPVALDWDDAGVLFLFFCSIAFILGYSLRAHWWEYLVGRAMVLLDVVVMLTLLPSASHLLFHTTTHGAFFTWYTPISCFATGLAILWRLGVVWCVNGHRDPEPPDTEETIIYDRVREE